MIAEDKIALNKPVEKPGSVENEEKDEKILLNEKIEENKQKK